MKKLNIATLGLPDDYRSSLIPLIIRDLGYEIAWKPVSQADMLIYGPFYRKDKAYRWLPKPLRSPAETLEALLGSRKTKPLVLFQTGENIRPDFIQADYSISFDISDASHHLRFPYWMEMVDWSHEGITGNSNHRFGKLLSIDQMMRPLGDQFLKRDRKVAMITSHLNEPRKTLLEVLQKMIPVDGYGPYFNPAIKNHHTSPFDKLQVLSQYAFNLCPENSLYPGYYTEKIPEAFLAGCLPLTWVDSNVHVDFNPHAMINLQAMIGQGFVGLKELLHDTKQLQHYADQPLIMTRPSIEPCKAFLANVLSQVSSA